MRSVSFAIAASTLLLTACATSTHTAGKASGSPGTSSGAVTSSAVSPTNGTSGGDASASSGSVAAKSNPRGRQTSQKVIRPTHTAAPAPAAAVPPSGTVCETLHGNHESVIEGHNATCQFADAIAQALETYGSTHGSFPVSSSATGRTYQVTCTTGSDEVETRCTAGTAEIVIGRNTGM